MGDIKDRVTISFYSDVLSDDKLLNTLNATVPKRQRGVKLKEWALAYLKEHPELLIEPSEEKEEPPTNNRPNKNKKAKSDENNDIDSFLV